MSKEGGVRVERYVSNLNNRLRVEGLTEEQVRRLVETVLGIKPASQYDKADYRYKRLIEILVRTNIAGELKVFFQRPHNLTKEYQNELDEAMRRVRKKLRDT
jgi:hypothetical protein